MGKQSRSENRSKPTSAMLLVRAASIQYSLMKEWGGREKESAGLCVEPAELNDWEAPMDLDM